VVDEFLSGLDDNALLALPWMFEFWALPHQLPPDGAWKTWVIMGGRGAGKTRAGAEWVRAEVEGAGPEDPGRSRHVALVGETIDQVREVMVFGESGVLACSPPDRRPEWEAGRKRLVWPNGAVAQVFSAHEPESLRGPQFDAAWVDELGCPAVDKGTNEPNKFIDPKSSESRAPRFSTGRRDDLIQLQYLRAMTEFWSNELNNPSAPVLGGRMVDMSRAHVWAWDARPFPVFPNLSSAWSDGENYARGHWLNGRATGQLLSSVVGDLCERSGVTDFDTSRLFGYLRGYGLAEIETARSSLQPLMLAFGFDAIERDGVLTFRSRDARVNAVIDTSHLAVSDEIDGSVELTRGAETEVIGKVMLGYVEAEGDFATRETEAVFPTDNSNAVSQSEVPLTLTTSESRGIVERWLAESRIARDSIRVALLRSRLAIGAGDVISYGNARYRIDKVEQYDQQLLDGTRIEAASYQASDAVEERPIAKPTVAPVPVFSTFLDLPLLSGDEEPHAPRIAVSATPWPGPVAIWSSASDNGYALNRLISVPSIVGLTETPLRFARAGLIDRGEPLRVRVFGGAINSAEVLSILNGINAAAIGDGTPDRWEVFQFSNADLVGPQTYALGGRLRGQAGSDALIPESWPEGSQIVFLDHGPEQIALPLSARGLERHYRIGVAARGYDDHAVTLTRAAFLGAGLRPYRPGHLRLKRSEAGDLHVAWIRRTRIDGDGWQAADVPLGEATEAYLVRVLVGSALARETTVSEPNWIYSLSHQISDAALASCEIEVAQISERFGHGPFARIGVGE
jgi:hypothetical protein